MPIAFWIHSIFDAGSKPGKKALNLFVTRILPSVYGFVSRVSAKDLLLAYPAHSLLHVRKERPRTETKLQFLADESNFPAGSG